MGGFSVPSAMTGQETNEGKSVFIYLIVLEGECCTFSYESSVLFCIFTLVPTEEILTVLVQGLQFFLSN